MAEHEYGTEQTVKLRNELHATVTTADGRVRHFPDPTRFWPVFLWNLRGRKWRAVRHNLRHDAHRKLLRRY